MELATPDREPQAAPSGHAASALPLSPACTPRPKINTFDIFDTLIARRCIEPARVFDMVEMEAGISGFAQARKLAEASVAQGPYDLDAIYGALSAMLGLDPDTTNRLKRLEIEIEIANVMPVAENIAQVADGDVMISDMYLGADTIRRLLDKAGFDRKASLVVTSDGKHSGRIWPLVLAKFGIEQHLGDNLHSDHAMPRRFGIPARHTNVTAPSLIERTLLDIGLRDLAAICREARLATWSPDGELRALQLIQVGLNLPILVLGSIALARLARREGIRSILFSSRDCELWLSLFRALGGSLGVGCRSDYFYTSRMTRTQPSADYLAYAGDCIGPDSLVVDICGTGWSLAHLFRHLALEPRIFLLHQLPVVQPYERRARTPSGVAVRSLLHGVEDRCQNMALEMCNYALHGMVTDVHRIGAVALPVFAPDRRSSRMRTAIAEQRAAFLRAVDIVKAQGLRECLSIDDAALVTLCATLYQSLSRQRALYAVYAEQHLEEDRAVMRDLGCL